MPSIYQLKPKFQSMLRPVVKGLNRVGITPNQITCFALVASIGAGLWLYLSKGSREALLFLPAFLFVRMGLNAIDGMLAREFDQITKSGALLNELGDVISDTAIVLPFAVISGVPPLPVVVIAVFAIISEMAGISALMVGSPRRFDGPMGKSDRAFAFGLLGLLLGCGVTPGKWLKIGLWVIVALLVLTVINRSTKALSSTDDASTEVSH